MKDSREKSCSSFPAISRRSGKSCQLSSLFRVINLRVFIKDIQQRSTRSSHCLPVTAVSVMGYLYTIER